MLYGRDAERAQIGALLDGARSARGGVLVVRGEPGIGKTALLEDARDRSADMHVLTARGVESEAELPFAGLHRLLRPALHLTSQLPAPQSQALQGAFGLAEGSTHERFLVFAACLSLLSEMAERRPVLCIVDDAHWLDALSADALLFVARRVEAEGIVILFAARDSDVRTFEARDIPSLRLTGLGADAVTLLLERGAGKTAAPAVRDRIAELTGGNALALLELPAVLTDAQLAGLEGLPEALPLTQQVESVFLERVRRLSDSSQRFLLVAAADDTGDLTVVTRAAGAVGVPAEALAEVEAAGLVVVSGSQLAFRHPLVRSAVYAAATSVDRRSAHHAIAAALAEADEQADRRAWHLAASALEHDPEIVNALDGAAERAKARAGFLAASKALARAAELSADPESRGRRLVEAARCARIAGADGDAVELANRARPLVTDPSLRSEIALAVGVAAFRSGRPIDGVRTLLDSATEVSSLDPARAVQLLVWAMPCAISGGQSSALAEVADVAASVARDSHGGPLHMAHALAAISGAIAGEASVQREVLEEAFAWAAAASEPLDASTVGVAALYTGDHERSATLLDRAVALARERGEFGVLAEALTMRAFQFAFAERFDEAAIAAEESSNFARELTATNLAARSRSVLAFVAAIRGDETEARARANEVIEYAASHGPSLGFALALYSLAMLELGRGRWNEALEQFDALADARSPGSLYVSAVSAADRIEAAVHAGRMDAAQSALKQFESWAANSKAPWIPARLARSRALVAEGDGAVDHYEEALRHTDGARPFDLGRIRLAYGECLRRQRRRVDARAQLRAAIEIFDRLRAEPWAERARIELRASGETARRRDPSTVSQLTPQELQVARFVAEGLSNKEVAAQLFLSPRTIDSHLRNVFSKLGITSRTQLARLSLGAEGLVPERAPVPSPA